MKFVSYKNIFGFKLLMLSDIEKLARHLIKVWKDEKNLFICGNGGSAANAIHMANDFHYGVGACGKPPFTKGLKVEALPSKSGVITCLANDLGYEHIYSEQLKVKANKNDLNEHESRLTDIEKRNSVQTIWRKVH